MKENYMFENGKKRCMSILLIAFIVVLELLSSETVATENKYSFEKDIAKYRLKPPDTSSPRATLEGFIESMNRG